MGITEPTSLKGKIVDNRLKKQGIPFQLVFLKSVQKIKRTSVQIVSYMRNEKTIFLRSPDID